VRAYPPGIRALATQLDELLQNRNLNGERVEWSPSRKVAPMASDYYLLKTEPTSYSFADLQRDSVTEWDGVSNPVALRNLREMKPGTKLIIYETGDLKSVVGTAAVVKVNTDDPKNPVITIKAGKALTRPVTLAEIKADSLFGDSPLVRQGRLSVVPLSSAQYKILTKS
jgi:predicted RNA-binding protein with PUA-like domain